MISWNKDLEELTASCDISLQTVTNTTQLIFELVPLIFKLVRYISIEVWLSSTMDDNREWMYKRYLPGRVLNPEFLDGLQRFIQFALSQPKFKDGHDKIKCPCIMCENIPYLNYWLVRTHIRKYGFVRNYKLWRFQGETLDMKRAGYEPNPIQASSTASNDLAGPGCIMNNTEETPDNTQEPPNSEAHSWIFGQCRSHSYDSGGSLSENYIDEVAFNKKAEETTERLREELMQFQAQLEEEMESRLRVLEQEAYDRIMGDDAKAIMKEKMDAMFSQVSRDSKAAIMEQFINGSKSPPTS